MKIGGDEEDEDRRGREKMTRPHVGNINIFSFSQKYISEAKKHDKCVFHIMMGIIIYIKKH